MSLHVRVCVWMQAYIHLFICLCVHVYACMCSMQSMCEHASMHAYMCVYVVCVVCVCVYLCVRQQYPCG